MSICADSIKPFVRTAMTSGTGNITKTQVYYPGATRPRSFSAGCSSTSIVTKRPGSTNSAKVLKLNSRLSYPRTKSTDENKPSTTARYKTELCRPFQDYGFCRYGDKCQFAHGEDDLRVLPRHPKYKTDLCRTYHTRGFCPYGSRCHFIHNLDEARKPSDETPPSPKNKKNLSFSLPMSPLLDSGISSPDDSHSLASNGSGVFDFQSIDAGSGSSSEDGDFPSCLPEANIPTNLYSPLPGPSYLSHSPEIHEKYMEYDSLSIGSTSPMKRLSDLFDPEPHDLSSLIQVLKIEDHGCSRTSSGHRLPVFDTIANSSEPQGNPLSLPYF